MRTNIWRLTSLFMLLALLLSPLTSSGNVSAAPQTDQPQEDKGPIQVINASSVVESQPLISIEPKLPTAKEVEVARSLRDRLSFPKVENANNGASDKTDQSIVQSAPVGDAMPSSIASFDGTGNVSGVLPPDTVGDIGYDSASGKKYYMQWVNLAFQIWDVTNPAAPASVYGPTAGNTLFTSLGGACAANNDGDPIVLFDQLANRWMVSQFALSPDFHQCIAVSATADPTGTWYLYDFLTSTTLMNDYPHLGIWPDGYYMTVNQFNGSTSAWEGAGVAVFERDTMLLGLPSRMIYIDIGASNLDYGGMLPTDLDGLTAPPVGTPNYFMEWDDSTSLGDPTDTLRIWEFDVDWTTPANTTFGANASFAPNLLVPTSNVNPSLTCSGRSCIPQPGTTQGLDAIADRLMHRLAYRNFGTHQAIVGNHTVNAAATGSQAGVHWFELRDTGTGFAMHQEGVYAPDTDQRWMASIAMDTSGNMALGYSVSSSSTYPSVRYTGRLAGDPLDTLPQGEASLVAGAGSQTHSAARWGDYSSMTVDPQDDCTFWYTQEYYATTSSSGWKTRIGSFKFPSCTSGPTGTLTGTVTSGATPLAGATVSLSGGASATTNASGVYTIELPVGSYDLTVSRYGYIAASVTGVSVTNGSTTTQNVNLSPAPTSTISGVVTDAATNWPLYARLDIAGYPGGPVFTNPVTGAYSISLVDASYTFTVTALSGGYTAAVTPLVVAGNATQDFALNVAASCSAPGYVVGGLQEAFEVWPPAGWTVIDNIVGGGLMWNTNTVHGEGNYTGGSGLAATVSSDFAQYTPYNTELRSPTLDPLTLPSLTLTYRANYQDYTAYDALDLDITINGGTTWTNISHWVVDHSTLYGTGENVTVDLTPYATSNFQLRWHYYTSAAAPWDWYAQIDNVSLGASCNPIPSGGLVVGSAFDDNTSLPISGASVQSGAISAVMIDASADPATPDELYVIGLPSGSQSITASAYQYGDKTDSVAVVSGDTVAHDFDLSAGQLSVAPTSLTFNVTTAAPTDSENATLSNTGGAPAGYEIFAMNGVYSAPVASGPFADNTRHTGPKNLNDRTAENLRILPIRPYTPPLAAGDVSTSWNTGLTYAWGIGYNTTDTDLWLGDIVAGGGTGYNTRFTTAGVNTGDSINTASWVGSWNADMTYNPFTKTLWQVNVGGDNCVYEMDPATLTNTGNKICPAFGTPQRGLAYDPINDTYFSGSWTDFIINRFSPDGTLLSAVNVNLSIAGLAYNPVSQHLFVLSNTDSTTTPANYDITVLDASTPGSYPVIGGFNIKNGAANAFADFSQAGLEIDCAGNLWAVEQDAQKVYVAASGETGVCGWLASWLSVAPDTGSVPASGSTPLAVSVDATSMAVGTYHGYLRIANNTPYGDEILPVTMNVLPASVIPNPWIGGVSIASDQSVVAVARPHLGSEVASYIGATAGSTTQYVPMLFKGAFSGTYNAALYIQNVSATAATLSLEFTNDSGTVVYTKTDTLDPHASKGYWLPTETGLPAGFAGGVKVTSTQPILAVGRPHINGQVMTYNGMSSGATTAWLPMFFKNGFSGSYNAALYVQNVTGSSANLTIEYINLDGTVACTDNDTLGANASKGYWSLQVACDTGSLPSGFVGGVKVTSTQNILAVGRAHLGTQITTYNGSAAGATSAYVPMLFKNAFSGGSYDAALYLQNVSGSSATVTIEYLNSAGTVAATQNVTLAANAISSIWLPSLVSLADGFAGGARITSTQNVIAVARPHLGSEVSAYNGAPTGSLNAYLPMLFKNAYGTYQSAFYVQNTSGSAANVNISFYDSAGVLSCVKSVALAAGATEGFWMPTVTCAP